MNQRRAAVTARDEPGIGDCAGGVIDARAARAACAVEKAFANSPARTAENFCTCAIDHSQSGTEDANAALAVDRAEDGDFALGAAGAAEPAIDHASAGIADSAAQQHGKAGAASSAIGIGRAIGAATPAPIAACDGGGIGHGTRSAEQCASPAHAAIAAQFKFSANATINLRCPGIDQRPALREHNSGCPVQAACAAAAGDVPAGGCDGSRQQQADAIARFSISAADGIIYATPGEAAAAARYGACIGQIRAIGNEDAACAIAAVAASISIAGKAAIAAESATNPRACQNRQACAVSHVNADAAVAAAAAVAIAIALAAIATIIGFDGCRGRKSARARQQSAKTAAATAAATAIDSK